MTASRDKPLITASTSAHGVDLVDPVAGSPQVRQAVLRLIQAITRG